MQAAIEAAYKKDLKNNYMVLEKAMYCDYTDFCVKMLERQEIDGLLSLEERLIDNKFLFYYDITGRQTIGNILEKSLLSVKDLKALCMEIIQTIEMAYEYLLSEDDFVLAPDFIYQDISSGKIFLCLYPGYGIDIKEQMSGLMEFLMNKVDYNDKEAVYLVYRLYAANKEEGYTFGHLKEVLFEKADFKKPVKKAAVNDIKDEGMQEDKIPDKINIAGNMGEAGISVVMEKVEGEEEVDCYSLTTYILGAVAILAGIAVLAACIVFRIVYNSLGTRIDYSKLAGLLIILACLESYIMSKLFDKKRKITKIVRTREYIDPRLDYGSSYPAYKDKDSKFIKNISDQFTSVIREYKNKFKVARNSSLNSCDKIFVATDNSLHKSSKDCRHTSLKNTDNLYDKASFKPNMEADGSSPTCLLNYRMDEIALDNIAPQNEGMLGNEDMPILKALDNINYKDIPVTHYPFFIGKLKQNMDFHLDSETVSRYHAKITKEGESFFITDLNSTNGTFINDELLQTYQKKEIKFGDIIAFANIKYRFARDKSC